MSFPRYPEYKDSGVEWLSSVPSHWTLTPLWTLFGRVKRNGYSGERLLSVYRDYGVIPKASRDDNFNKPSEDLSQYQLVNVGDLVVNKMKAWQGSVGISKYEGIVSPAYYVYKSDHQEISTYLHYLFRSNQYIAGYMANSKGIRVNQWDLEPQQHSRMPVLLPPECEQSSIARLLDHETAKIDALIEEQQRLIKLLKEKRQAVISHAVTKGLDPDAPMKDSGVEWLGDVPAHWSVCALRYLSTERCDGPFGSGLKSSHYTEDGARVIRLQNIRAGRFSDADAAHVDLEYFKSALLKHSVAPGDVLIAGLGDERNMVGRACVAPDNLGPALVKADCFRFRLDARKADSAFVAYQLTAGAKADGPLLASGSTRQRIPLLSMGSRKIAVPPVVEQEQIVEFIQDQIHQIDQMDSNCRDAIELLTERRSALISAAVTGKIDVRNLQSQSDTADELPMAAEEPATYEAREQ